MIDMLIFSFSTFFVFHRLRITTTQSNSSTLASVTIFLLLLWLLLRIRLITIIFLCRIFQIEMKRTEHGIQILDIHRLKANTQKTKQRSNGKKERCGPGNQKETLILSIQPFFHILFLNPNPSGRRKAKKEGEAGSKAKNEMKERRKREKARRKPRAPSMPSKSSISIA